MSSVAPSRVIPAAVTFDQLAQSLSEGVDLCVRARKLDDRVKEALAAGLTTDTRCGTLALWVVEQYERDVAAWEAAAKTLLARLPTHAGLLKDEPQPPVEGRRENNKDAGEAGEAGPAEKGGDQ